MFRTVVSVHHCHLEILLYFDYAWHLIEYIAVCQGDIHVVFIAQTTNQTVIDRIQTM